MKIRILTSYIILILYIGLYENNDNQKYPIIMVYILQCTFKCLFLTINKHSVFSYSNIICSYTNLQGNFMFTVLKKNIREKSRFINTLSLATKIVDFIIIDTLVYNSNKQVVE